MTVFTRNAAKHRKRIKQKTQKGIIHIHSTYNNTLITVSTMHGKVVTWISTGICGFHGARKKAPFAAKVARTEITKKCLEQGIREVRVYVWGPGRGREDAIRGIYETGIRVLLIRDITSPPHNGCRSPKRRRK